MTNITTPGLLEQVRRTAEYVAQRAAFVHIDYESIPRYAASLPLEKLHAPPLDPALHYLGHGKDTLSFFVTLETINFGSGYLHKLHQPVEGSGYYSIAHSWNAFYAQHGPPSAEQLTRLTAQACAHIFGQRWENEAARELMGLFATALNELGRYLSKRFGGSCEKLIQSAAGSAERLVEILVEMPFFNDVASYQNQLIHFYKRAQIMAADLSLAFGNEGLGRFHDLNKLTMFADNTVPHVLRLDGILRYEASLAERIDRGAVISPGSPEEIELRASAIHALELIKQELSAAGENVSSMYLDYLIWNRGQEPRYQRNYRPHLTPTVFY